VSIRSLYRVMAVFAALLIASIFTIVPPTAHAATLDTTIRVSVSATGTQGNSSVFDIPSISGDGKEYAFASRSSNLVPNDTNNAGDIFVYDTSTTPITVDRITDNSAVNSYPSSRPVLSQNGRYLAFVGDGSLKGSPTYSFGEVYLFDRQTRTLNYASIDYQGDRATASIGASYLQGSPSISSDGRYVVFQTDAVLDQSDTYGSLDIYQYDSSTNSITLVSKNQSGVKGNGDSFIPDISSNGRYIAYYSTATNLDINTADNNSKNDVFVYDRNTNKTVLASRATGATGAIGNSHSGGVAVSDNGKVAFVSSSTNLATSCATPAPACMFVRDIVNKTTISLKSFAFLDGRPDISRQGNFVAFQTLDAIDSSDTNGVYDIYRYSISEDKAVRVSGKTDGTQGNKNSYNPTISDDGTRIAYQSDATTLVDNDTNNEPDAFVYSYKQWATPVWWSSAIDCDSKYFNKHKPAGVDTAKPLSTTGWRGIIPCGPIGSSVAMNIGRSIPLGSENEWQCTELAKRYLYVAYNLSALPNTNGVDVATNYYGHYPAALDHVDIDQTTHELPHDLSQFPKEGSVISYTPNHVAIVTHVDITDQAQGNATITVMEQNITTSPTGFSIDHIQGWVYASATTHAGLTAKDWITPK
jgi:hypothetical protein